MARKGTSKRCTFCTQNINQVDYKNAKLLNRFINAYAKIETRRRSGNCAKHQRLVATAVKRARIAALMPYTLR